MAKKENTQLSLYQRQYMKDLLDEGYTRVKIAETIGVHRSTVYNELKRGSVNGVYDPMYSEKRAMEQNAKAGVKSILEQDQELAAYISQLILKRHLSPQRIVEYLKTEDHGFKEYPTTPTTIYAAIDKGLIPNVSRKDLNGSGVDKDLIEIASNGIQFPAWLRKKAGLKNGDKIGVIYKKNGEILLRKIKNKKDEREFGRGKRAERIAFII